MHLSGVKLVPPAINEDHSLSEGSTYGIPLPNFDGENTGGAVPHEAIEMFNAKGVAASPQSLSGFITRFWVRLDANDEAGATAKNNTVAQKAYQGFSGAVGLALL